MMIWWCVMWQAFTPPGGCAQLSAAHTRFYEGQFSLPA